MNHAEKHYPNLGFVRWTCTFAKCVMELCEEKPKMSTRTSFAASDGSDLLYVLIYPNTGTSSRQ